MREIMVWLMIKYPDGMEQHRNRADGWMPDHILKEMHERMYSYTVFRDHICDNLGYYDLETGLTEKGWEYIRKEVEKTETDNVTK